MDELEQIVDNAMAGNFSQAILDIHGVLNYIIDWLKNIEETISKEV